MEVPMLPTPSGGAVPPAAPPYRRTAAEEILEAIRRRWGLIATIALGTALIAWLVASLQPNRYRSSAIAAIAPIAGTLSPADQIRGVQALDQSTFVATVAAMVSTPTVKEAAMSAGEKGYDVRGIVLPSTNLLRIEVEGENAARAAAIANRVPPILGNHTKRIFEVYGVAVVSPATSGELVSPRKERAAAAGVVVGLLLGTTLAWLLTRSRAAKPVIAPSAGTTTTYAN
jgi:capsular polysaccharide biosynthesis protein